MDPLQTQSLIASLAAYAQHVPSGQQRLEIERLIAVQSDKGQRARIRQRAMIYPLLVLGLCGAVLLFMSITIVPTFRKMFDEFGMTRPPLTGLVVGLSEQVLLHPVRFSLSILIAVVVMVGVVRLLQSFAFGTRFLGIIHAGSMHHLVTMAGICNRLADAFDHGMPLPAALRSAAEECDNSYFAAALRTFALDAQKGVQGLDRSSVAHNFPANLIHALSAGPGGQAHVPLLRTLGDIYQQRAAWRWDVYGGILGPLTLILVGIVVAIVIVSLFQPFIEMISGLS